MTRRRQTVWLAGAALGVLLAGCDPVSDPWVSGERLDDERTRGESQGRELERRLLRAGVDR